jgi:hypothetical protein
MSSRIIDMRKALHTELQAVSKRALAPKLMFLPSHVVSDLCSVNHISAPPAYGRHTVVGIDTAQYGEAYAFPPRQSIG